MSTHAPLAPDLLALVEHQHRNPEAALAILQALQAERVFGAASGNPRCSAYIRVQF